MESREEFSKLITKFLFLNCNDGHSDSSRMELNNLLNELNSLDYQTQRFVDSKTASRLVESFANIPTSEDTLIMKVCCLLVTLLNKQKIQLPVEAFKKSVDWLLKCINFNFRTTACDALSVMQALFKNHPSYCTQFWDLLSPDNLLLNILSKKVENKLGNYDANSYEELLVSTIFCIESMLPLNDDFKGTDQTDELLATVGSKVLDTLYTQTFKLDSSVSFMMYATSALSVLFKIANENQEWCENYLGELIGIAKTFMHFGLPDIPRMTPQKVHVSQQSVLETPAVQASKGGKVAKTRRPRTVNKNKKTDNKKGQKTEEAAEQSQCETGLKVDFDSPFLSPFNKTSDSDFSESEAGRAQNERHKQAKLRLSAISLLGLIAKNTEKRTLYGYWHSLFPQEQVTHTSTGLLNSVLRDPNPRCRIAALQTTSIMLFGSKAYLLQAESSDKAPTSFMPFSISLGNVILSMYEALTQALSTESSLPVLTQILKCLSVLIQATPFHRLKIGFVTNFVKYIRRLVYHRDPTIQVAALMVMEFLISVQDITTEISECVDIPKSSLQKTKKNQNQLNDAGVNQLIEPELEEEIIDSDYEEEIPEIKDDKPQTEYPSSSRMSWLLQRVLENLGVPIGQLKVNSSIAATPVRIECLQVLSSMAPHFLLLKNYLDLVGKALQISLEDSQSDIRLYTGKCLDVLGHSINTYLLETETPSPEDLNICQQFWTSMLPPVIQKVQDPNQIPALKAVLCDFMSNIGVHIFERLPHKSHIQLISLLSGISCNEDSTVRAAAVRALAVYVMFPSLREDLCFVENTAEAIIQLMHEQKLYIRVKTSWAMGNISDALMANCVESRFDRISIDLFKRLFEIAIISADDNDKVRSNAVRTLGNLLRLITVEHLKSNSWRELSMRAIEKLVNCMTKGGNSKVKWNACYAIGNFMRNPALFSPKANINWQQIVFPSLCNLIVNSTNFKVRINGAAALSTINERDNYGTHLLEIWSSLLLALEQSDNLVDFNEYKHRDNLQEQLCLTLCHILKIASTDDYISLKNALIPKLESVKQNWVRVTNRVLPENAAPLISCPLELGKILQTSQLSSEQKNALQVLMTCFVQPNHEFF